MICFTSASIMLLGFPLLGISSRMTLRILFMSNPFSDGGTTNVGCDVVVITDVFVDEVLGRESVFIVVVPMDAFKKDVGLEREDCGQYLYLNVDFEDGDSFDGGENPYDYAHSILYSMPTGTWY